MGAHQPGDHKKEGKQDAEDQRRPELTGPGVTCRTWGPLSQVPGTELQKPVGFLKCSEHFRGVFVTHHSPFHKSELMLMR